MARPRPEGRVKRLNKAVSPPVWIRIRHRTFFHRMTLHAMLLSPPRLEKRERVAVAAILPIWRVRDL